MGTCLYICSKYIFLFFLFYYEYEYLNTIILYNTTVVVLYDTINTTVVS